MHFPVVPLPVFIAALPVLAVAPFLAFHLQRPKRTPPTSQVPALLKHTSFEHIPPSTPPSHLVCAHLLNASICSATTTTTITDPHHTATALRLSYCLLHPLYPPTPSCLSVATPATAHRCLHLLPTPTLRLVLALRASLPILCTNSARARPTLALRAASHHLHLRRHVQRSVHKTLLVHLTSIMSSATVTASLTHIISKTMSHPHNIHVRLSALVNHMRRGHSALVNAWKQIPSAASSTVRLHRSTPSSQLVLSVTSAISLGDGALLAIAALSSQAVRVVPLVLLARIIPMLLVVRVLSVILRAVALVRIILVVFERRPNVASGGSGEMSSVSSWNQFEDNSAQVE